LLYPEFLQRIRDGRANAGRVLVIAGAVNFIMLAVQQKALVLVEANGADAELGFFWSSTPLAMSAPPPMISTVVISL